MPGILGAPVRGIILAEDDAADLSPVTGPEQPIALLPVANRPMIYFALLSLLRADVLDVAIVVPTNHVEAVQAYVAMVGAGDFKAMVIRVCSCDQADGTADAVRALERESNGTPAHTLLLSAGLVADCALAPLMERHFETGASCTALFAERCPPAHPLRASGDEQKGGKGGAKGGAKGGGKGGGGKSGGGRKKDQSSAGKDSAFEPEVFVTSSSSSSRLLGVVAVEDVDEDEPVRLRPTLLQRFDRISVRSDLRDLGVYMFAPWVTNDLLPARPRIKSIEYDLLPYLARRQFSLSRKSETRNENWAELVPEAAAGEVVASLYVEQFGGFTRRIGTCETYRDVVLDVAGGALVHYLGGPCAVGKSGGRHPGAPKEKKKGGAKAPKAESPFVTAGEKTNVSADSVVGSDCTAGDRTSVKKSCVGDNVSFAANAKVNGCVVLSGVKIGEGVSLTGCVLSSGASVEAECVLKNCRVAAGVVVPAGTESEGHDFTGTVENEDVSDFGSKFEFSFS